MPQNYEMATEWFVFASERTLGVRESCRFDDGSDSLRYFIVGNYTQGFLGIERDMNVPCCRNEQGWICWAFQPLDEKKCRMILKTRLYEFK
jgi:hypothetical protein